MLNCKIPLIRRSFFFLFVCALTGLFHADLAAAESQADREAKNKLMRDHRRKVIEAKAKGVNVSADQAAAVCDDASSTVTDCIRAIRAAEKGFDQALKEAEASQKAPNVVVVQPGSGRIVRPNRPNRPIQRPNRPVQLPVVRPK